ncbi:M23 family metallopeptidase [Asticcacaulis sp. 201]|uniref:M23 family metallopeptidase n=1 Tax=Asticcacaulis sp. 201 TaxID=3028787 RepID=UPI002916EC1D|nr:peptidoglycan DD-metalloendopeptidase family protein [Asticcacaulis sp. 201]MDV6332903.1 peptidoglycan DD-metalloendopeptidase family protein [Asticcacaulis sp. 201]
MSPFISISRVSIVALLFAVAACSPQTQTGSQPSSQAASAVLEDAISSFVDPSSAEVFDSASEPAAGASTSDFPHEAPTALVAGSGSGYSDLSNWAPGICFPVQGAAYANSQVYSPGGDHYPSPSATNHGSQCDSKNYAFPWHDNFCEARSWTNPVCASGSGHQGQDIRPASCKANQYWAVAAEDGIVTQVGSYTVAITGNAVPHRIFRYLHMQKSSVKVAVGDKVLRGQKLGLISNNLGVSNGVQQYTTIHLHFEVRVAQAETMSDGKALAANAFVPPYTALVNAYQRRMAGDCDTTSK